MADELIQPGIFEGMTWWNSNNMSMSMNMNMMQMMNNPSKSSSCFLASPSPPAFCSQMQLSGDTITNNILGYGGSLGWSNHQDPICGNYSSSNKAVVSRSSATCYGGFYEDDDATTNSPIVGGGNSYNPPLFVSRDMGTSISTCTVTTVGAAPDSSLQDWSPQDTLVSNTSNDQTTNYYMGNNMDHQYPMLSKVDIINDFGAVQDHHHHQGLISISSPSSSSSPPMNSSVNSEGSTVTVDHNNPPAASANLIQTLISSNEPTTNNQLQLLFSNNMGALNHHIDNYIGMINNNMPINEIPNSWNNFANSHDNSKSTAAAAALAASLEDIRASLLFSPPSSPLPPQPQPSSSSSSSFAASPPPNWQSSSAQFSRPRQAPNSSSEGNNNSSCATTTRDHQILTKNNKEKAGPTCNEPPLTKRPRIETPSPLPTFKVRKEKLGDRITALQQLVSPFGKTDTASVLHEAIEYIKFLHEQVNVLSTSYMKNAAPIQNHHRQQGAPPDNNHQDQVDLRSRGLCLVPISSTFPVAHETPADFWTPTFGTSFR